MSDTSLLLIVKIFVMLGHFVIVSVCLIIIIAIIIWFINRTEAYDTAMSNAIKIQDLIQLKKTVESDVAELKEKVLGGKKKGKTK